MDYIILPDNHRRSVSALIYMIEKIVDEIERDVLFSSEKITCKIIKDENEINLNHFILVINEIKSNIQNISAKYNLTSRKLYMNQIINARKSKMWEILCDTLSKKLKGYGEFPKEYALEFDNDIN